MRKAQSVIAAFKPRPFVKRLSNPHTAFFNPFLQQRSTMAATPPMENVAVELPDGLTPEELKSFKPFREWMANISKSLSLQSKTTHPFHSSPYSLRSIKVQSFDRFGSQGLGFVKIAAAVSNSAGESLPAIALLRGPSVAMLVMLIPDDAPPGSDERYVVLTVQPRIPAGYLGFVELPAGMVDNEGSFKGAAAKEIEEELGLVIKEDELVCLSELADRAAKRSEEELPAAMFPSAGGCDEHITIYSYEKRIPRSQLKSWEGKLTGLRSKGEKITLTLVAMKDLWREGARDSKCLAAVALWEGLKREKLL
ncbi:hypothetical protein QQS21_004599 [Conoideocrella luteorostrata]|uniref:Nudix hydrolase domain-containing protein n=1 Tax=Conoideocrella luteorostrata TaxID=1105319 RepID=A0AAJ0FZP3_9HYPO|nr:hypothetical protein QQS21_004599 [Conoideocrella luteorostrata]